MVKMTNKGAVDVFNDDDDDDDDDDDGALRSLT